MTNLRRNGRHTARELKRDANKKRIKKLMPPDGSPIAAGRLFELCLALDPPIYKREANRAVRELALDHEVFCQETTRGGSPRVTYHLMTNFNRPMRKMFLKAVLESIREEGVDAETMSAADLAEFDFKQRVVLDWGMRTALVVAVQAPNSEQTSVVLEAYTKEVFLPSIRAYIQVMRRSPHGGLQVRTPAVEPASNSGPPEPFRS